MVLDLARMILDVNSITDRPATYTGTMEEKVAWLNKVATHIVDTVWIPTNKDDIAEVAGAMKGDPYGYCKCATGNIHAVFITYYSFETQSDYYLHNVTYQLQYNFES